MHAESHLTLHRMNDARRAAEHERRARTQRQPRPALKRSVSRRRRVGTVRRRRAATL